jgi:uncharacterized membrane protein YbhN (UPF0104 family)
MSLSAGEGLRKAVVMGKAAHGAVHNMDVTRLTSVTGGHHGAPGSPTSEKHQSLSWFRWGTVVVGLILFAVLMAQVSWAEFGRVLSRVEYIYVAVALVLGLITNMFRVLRFNYLYPVQGRWLDAYSVFALYRFINYVLPFHSGELVALGMLKQRKLVSTVAETSAGWFLMRVCDLVALLLLVTVVGAMNFSTVVADPNFTWVYITIALIAGTLFLAIPLGGKFLLRQPASDTHGGWFAHRVRDFVKGLSRITTPPVMAGTLGFSVLVWVANMYMMVFALLTFHTPLSLSQCAVVVGLALTISLLPVRGPLGLGTGDATWVAALILFDIPAPEAIALALGVRLIQMLITGLEGGVGFALSLRAMPALHART